MLDLFALTHSFGRAHWFVFTVMVMAILAASYGFVHWWLMRD